MPNTVIRATGEGGVLTLRLNRPEKKTALSGTPAFFAHFARRSRTVSPSSPRMSIATIRSRSFPSSISSPIAKRSSHFFTLT